MIGRVGGCVVRSRKPPSCGGVIQWQALYRSFDFGNLLTLHMLDTSVVGRDAPISRDQYPAGAAADPNRQLLGAEQASWLSTDMQASRATWQVLGQRVLMGRM